MAAAPEISVPSVEDRLAAQEETQALTQGSQEAESELKQVQQDKTPLAEDTSSASEPTNIEVEAGPDSAAAEDNSGAAAVDDADQREASPVISEGSVEDAAATNGVEIGAKPKGSPTKVKTRKEDKSIEHVLKALNSLETTEEKLAALCKKYTELLEEHRLLQNKFKQSQRKVSVISREKDQLQSDHSKAVLAKSKLESLCRELQRHNKLVKEESLARAKEEEEKRKEVTSKFQTTINDIQKQMNENYEKNNKLREENIELASKLKNLIEQYELREQHIEKVFKHKELEQQLVDAKLAQATLQMTQEKEQSLKEKEVLLHDAHDSQKKINLLEAQEQQLRAQVAIYTEKYEEFQQTLAKSNEVFGSFKTEMDKMTKKIKKLEKETTMWRTRWENSNKTLLQMAEEKTRSDKDIATLNSKLQKLESLCRALQSERKKHLAGGKEATETLNASLNGALQTAPKDNKDVIPTKTPPNTPENDSTRASPVTVQPDNRSGESSTSGDAPPSQSEPAIQPEEEKAAPPLDNSTGDQDNPNGEVVEAEVSKNDVEEAEK